jgi:hypothetical protein
VNNNDAAPGVQGLIKIPFTTNNHRDFNVYLRLNSSETGNSFWLQIDEGAFTAHGAVNTNGEWQWVRISGSALLAGPHTVSIGFQKGGIKLDRIYITNDSSNQPPTGTGGQETSCIAIPRCFIFDFENGNINGWTKQNPGGGIDITQEDRHSGNYALKMVNASETNAWSVQAFTAPVDVVSGHAYNVSFWVRAVNGGGKGRISTTGSGQLGSQYWNDFNVGDTWQKITYSNLTAAGNTVQLAFDMGYVANKTYYIDDIVFEDITAVPQPEVRVQAAVWDAGKVIVNSSVQSDRFSIRNTGSGTLDITGVTQLSAPWTTTLNTGSGLSLGAGQVQEFTFTYAPTAEGVSTVDFTVNTNAGNAVIQLTGEGIPVGGGNAGVESRDIHVYSPAPGKISVRAPENSKVMITDILGRTVGQYNIYSSPAEFSLYSGIFIVRVESKNAVAVRKIAVRYESEQKSVCRLWKTDCCSDSYLTAIFRTSTAFLLSTLTIKMPEYREN